jgi:general secretion pathway protein D
MEMKRSSAVECAEGVSTRMGNMDRAVRIAWKILAVSLVVCLWSPAGVAQVTRRGGPPPGPGRRGGLRARRTEDRPPFLREAATPTGTNVSAPSEGSRLEVLPGDDGGKTIGMDVYGLDIDHLLRILSDEAQVTIIKDEEVRGTVTIIAPKPVPIEVAFQILDSVLAIRGYTMLRTEIGIYKVVSVDKARQSGAPLQFGARLDQYPPGDELITQVIPLENLDASDLANQLQSLLSPNANIVPTSTNSLIITDTAENISRALALIEDTERQLAGGPRVYPLQYYDAGEMAELVTSLVLSRGGGAQRGPRPAWERRVVGRGGQQPRPTARATAPAQAAAAGPEFAYPDTRTNSLIVLATPVHLMQIENLIAQLDRPVSLRDTYFVYPVQNLVASELAELLAPLINAQVVKGGDTGSSRREVGRPSTAFSRQPQQYGSPFAGQRSVGARSVSPSGGRFDRQSSAEVYLEPLAAESSAVRASDRLLVAQAEGAAMQPAVAPQVPPPPTGIPAAATYEDAAAVTGAGVAESVVAADDNTNTLLISAPPEQVDLVKQMLEKLDVLPPQVHIRAIIAEVLLTHETSLGFEWQSLGRTWGTHEGEEYTGNIGTGFGLAKPTAEAVPTGFFATITDTEFQAVLNALTSDSNTRILAAPSIFTTNNQEAEINVSQQIPIPTGTFQSTVGAETISTSIKYESVGIVLNVTPTVTQGDMVRFLVNITSNDVGADVEVGGQIYPSILNRSANAVLNLRDGDTVVLGGLMRDGMMETSKRVPILGSLPLVGFLFRSTTSTNVKSELLVFLTPHIVRTPGEAARLTESEKLRLPEVPRSLRQDAGQVDKPEYWPSEFDGAEPDTAEVPAPEGASVPPDDAAEESAPPEEEWQEEPMGDTADSTSLPPGAPQPEEVSSPP